MGKVTKIEMSRPIKTLEDLKFQRNLLENKVLKKEQKLFRKSKKLKKHFSVQTVYSEILEEFELNGSIVLNILPIALKKINESKEYFKDSKNKTVIYATLGALLATITTIFIQKQQSKK